MPRSVFVPQHLLSAEAVRLGRFVTDIDHPQQDYHDPPVSDAPPTIIHVQENYQGHSEETKSATFSSALTAFLASSFSRRTGSRLRLVTERVQTYSLDNSSSWFHAATQSPDTRVWLERAIDQGDDIFLIVGYHTITNARISVQSAQMRGRGGTVGLPVGPTLAATGMIIPVGDLVETKVELESEQGSGISEQFLAPGEQVCAIQYRRIRHKFLSGKKLGDASLAKQARWKVLDRSRDDTDGGDDVIEIEVVDDDWSDLDGSWVRQDSCEDYTLVTHG